MLRLGDSSLTAVLLLGLAGCERSATGPSKAVADALGQAESAETSTFVINVPIAFSQLAPCVDEVIDWEGQLHVVFHVTNNRGVDPNVGFQHFVDNETLQLIGIGQTSGREYHSNGPQRFFFQAESPTESFPLASSFVREQVITSPGSGFVMRVRFRVPFVINANGEIVVDDFLFEIEC